MPRGTLPPSARTALSRRDPSAARVRQDGIRHRVEVLGVHGGSQPSRATAPLARAATGSVASNGPGYVLYHPREESNVYIGIGLGTLIVIIILVLLLS
jgi:hypothetical protein